MSLRRAAAGILAAALLAGCQGVAPSAGARHVSYDPADGPLLSAAIFRASNRARAAEGLWPLARLGALDSAADRQAQHTAHILLSEHLNPIASERTAADRVSGSGVLWTRVGENILMQPATPGAGAPPYTYDSLADFLVGAWMASPPHRANLLDRGYTHVGCAARFARGVRGDLRVFAVQDFVTREKTELSN
jgi:uncharacterized protein YkwD